MRLIHKRGDSAPKVWNLGALLGLLLLSAGAAFADTSSCEQAVDQILAQQEQLFLDNYRVTLSTLDPQTNTVGHREYQKSISLNGEVELNTFTRQQDPREYVEEVVADYTQVKSTLDSTRAECDNPSVQQAVANMVTFSAGDFNSSVYTGTTVPWAVEICQPNLVEFESVAALAQSDFQYSLQLFGTSGQSVSQGVSIKHLSKSAETISVELTSSEEVELKFFTESSDGPRVLTTTAAREGVSFHDVLKDAGANSDYYSSGAETFTSRLQERGFLSSENIFTPLAASELILLLDEGLVIALRSPNCGGGSPTTQIVMNTMNTQADTQDQGSYFATTFCSGPIVLEPGSSTQALTREEGTSGLSYTSVENLSISSPHLNDSNSENNSPGLSSDGNGYVQQPGSGSVQGSTCAPDASGSDTFGVMIDTASEAASLNEVSFVIVGRLLGFFNLDNLSYRVAVHPNLDSFNQDANCISEVLCRVGVINLTAADAISFGSNTINGVPMPNYRVTLDRDDLNQMGIGEDMILPPNETAIVVLSSLSTGVGSPGDTGFVDLARSQAGHSYDGFTIDSGSASSVSINPGVKIELISD